MRARLSTAAPVVVGALTTGALGIALTLRLLRGYVRHYNQQRPHRGLLLAVPDRREQGSMTIRPRDVRRRDVLGGLIREYHAVAA